MLFDPPPQCRVAFVCSKTIQIPKIKGTMLFDPPPQSLVAFVRTVVFESKLLSNVLLKVK